MNSHRILQVALRPAVVLAVLAACPWTGAAGAQAPDGWTLEWADEFATDGRPNPANWTYEIGLVRNEEAQSYQPANAFCRDGHLILEARRERIPNPGFKAGATDWRSRQFSDYSSASITTQGLHAWQYGRFEMRGRIDTDSGMWPAFWTLGADGEWPDAGEIDVMEFYRGMLLANVAWGSAKRWVATWDSVRTPITALGGPEWRRAFHVWRMDWDADRIELSVDGRVLNSTSVADTISPRLTRTPFRQPHFLLLSLAIAGQNGGDPSATTFPARFEVDYVRVYSHTPAVH